MPGLDSKTHRKRRVKMIRFALGNDLRRHRTDAGLSLGAVAGAADISRSHLCELETGKADASLPTLAALSDVLGADLSIRLYPNTGPRIRDHIQAQIVEELLRVAHARPRTRGRASATTSRHRSSRSFCGSPTRAGTRMPRCPFTARPADEWTSCTTTPRPC